MYRILAFCVALLWGGAAAAADQPTYGPPEAWVRPTPIPTSAAIADGAPYQFLLYDLQAKFSEAGEDYYVERALKIATPQGLNISAMLEESWDPDIESLVVHRLTILRGGAVINVLADGARLMVLRRENNLELAMLDGRLTATIQPEGLQVGDVIDFAYTVHRRDPALHGYAADSDKYQFNGVASDVHVRTLWPDAKPIRWRATDGIPTPRLTKGPDGVVFEVDMKNFETPKPPLAAPTRFTDLGVIEFSQFAGWPEVSRVMAPLYEKAETLKPGSPLAGEIARIAAASRDPTVRATMALHLVQEQTRYVFLGMNDGGLVPAQADATWSRRFGDCKGKTALLVTLLRGLGIDADPALVSTTQGDGMDVRLPMPGMFDHAIVRARIAGKTYWLDGTRVGDRSIADLVVPAYRWALPVRAAGADLERLDPTPLATPSVEENMRIDASKGVAIPAPTHLEVVYRGEDAAKHRQEMANATHADYERSLREFWTKTYPWLDLTSVSMAEDPATGTSRLIADGQARLDWNPGTGGDRIYRVPYSALGSNVSFKREPGPHQDAPYAVPFPTYSLTTKQIVLPIGGTYRLIGTDVDEHVAGQQLHRVSRIENGVLTVEMSTKSTQTEFPAAEADVDAATLRQLARSDVAVVFRTATAGLELFQPVASATVNTDLAAARRGDAAAQFRVGQMYATGQGLPYSPGQAHDWYLAAANQGYAPAEAGMANAYLDGVGVPRDMVLGLVWLRKAADHGAAEAQARLSYFYTAGIANLPRNPAKAFDLAQQAARKASPQGQYLLGMLYVRGDGVARDEHQAVAWMQKAADQGLPAAQIELGVIYHMGIGVPKDDAAALRWVRKAADRGDPGAQARIGEFYLHGYGVPVDRAAAISWYRKAADQNDHGAEVNLGYCYELGLGVPKDLGQAMIWYRKSAEGGNSFGAANLGQLYLEGRGVVRDYAQALLWLRRSAAGGNVRAFRLLGLMYLSGQGVVANKAQAVMWFAQAADQGDAPSIQELALLRTPILTLPAPKTYAPPLLGIPSSR